MSHAALQNSELYGRRARSVPELGQYMGTIFNPQAIACAREFRPAASDIVVATYPKCGTTWMQQIVHGVRTGGAMDFADISDKIPWIEMTPLLGEDLEADQGSQPRAFKTHADWANAPKGGRYIVVVRNPNDALMSFYHFMRGWLFEAEAIDVADFARGVFSRGGPFGTYWHHVRSWWAQRDVEPTLFITFEEMKRDLAGSVRAVADFVGAELDPPTMARVVEQSSFAFMKAHASKFDDYAVRAAIARFVGLPEGNQPPKVRAGQAGGYRKEMPEDVIAALDARWNVEMAETLGIRSYTEFADLIAAHHGR